MTFYRRGRELFQAIVAVADGTFKCGHPPKIYEYRAGDWIVTPIIGTKFVATPEEFKAYELF